MLKIMQKLSKLSAISLSALIGISVACIPDGAQARVKQAQITQGGETSTSRSLMLALDKAVIVELPAAAADVLVSQPNVVDAVIKTPTKVYLLGRSIGQANVFFFDSRGRQILNLELQVEPDLNALGALYKKLMPDSNIKLDGLSGSLVLRGAVESASEAKMAVDIATRFLNGQEDNIMNLLSVKERGQVMLKVRIVEMRRSLIRQLGINTSGTAQISDTALDFAVANAFGITGSALGGLGVTSSQSNVTDNLTSLNNRFDIFEQNNLVRTLAEPNLTAVSGENANFLAGGSFPVPTASGNGQTAVEFQDFGVGLGFTPVVLSKGRISLKVTTEVSEISATGGFSAAGTRTIDPETGELTVTSAFVVPALTRRSASTTVEMASGSSMAIAGLLQENISSTVDGVPGLKDVAVLGQLFRSNEFQNEETELVIIITPYLVEPASPNEIKTPTDGYVAPSVVQSFVLSKLEAEYGLRPSANGATKTVQGPNGFILD